MDRQKKINEKIIGLLLGLSDIIYQNILNQTKPLLRTPADDPVLVNVIPMCEMYLMVAHIKIRTRGRNLIYTEVDSFYYKSPFDIKFCVTNGLTFGAECKKSRICKFNIIELIGHLAKLEIKFSSLPFCDELIDYVAALEYRICKLLATPCSTKVHCLAASRVLRPDGKAVLTKKMENELIFYIVSIRKHFIGTVQAFSSYVSYIHKDEDEITEDEQNSLTAIVYALIDAYRVVHDEQLQSTFCKLFVKRTAYIRERFMYYNEFQVNTEINYINAIKKYRSQEVWYTISSSSRRGLDYYLKNDEESDFGFRISFILMIKHLLTVKCGGVQFDDYFIDQGRIKELTDEKIENIITLATKIPIFIISLNEACVLWQKEIYIFGCKNYDYVRAIFYWIRIIHEECDNRILGIYDIRPIIETFRKAYTNYTNFIDNTLNGERECSIKKITSCTHCSNNPDNEYKGVYERTENNIVYILCLNCQKVLQSYDIVDPSLLPTSSSSSTSSSSTQAKIPASLKFFNKICDENANLDEDSDDEEVIKQRATAKQHSKFVEDLRKRTGFDALKSELVDRIHDGEGYTNGTNDSGWDF